MQRTISIILLFFNGVSACFGGGALISDPSGRSIQMPLDMLKYGPFHNFLIPGLILFFVLGIGSLIAGILVIRRIKSYSLYIIFIGAALAIWILTQTLMIRGIHLLHFIYGGIGIVLLFLGIMKWKRQNDVNQASA